MQPRWLSLTTGGLNAHADFVLEQTIAMLVVEDTVLLHDADPVCLGARRIILVQPLDKLCVVDLLGVIAAPHKLTLYETESIFDYKQNTKQDNVQLHAKPYLGTCTSHVPHTSHGITFIHFMTSALQLLTP